jgi:hypothetical protein
MRNPQSGVGAQVVIGIILAILGVVAIIIAPDVMNYSEVGTLRKVGGGVIGLGVVLALVGLMNKKT